MRKTSNILNGFIKAGVLITLFLVSAFLLTWAYMNLTGWASSTIIGV